MTWGYAPALWLVALVLAFGLSGALDEGFEVHGDWPLLAFAVGPAATLLGGNALRDRGIGPFARHAAVYLRAAAPPVAAFAVLHFLAIHFAASGDAAPLPYLPIVDPAGIAVLLLFAALVDTWLQLRKARPPVLGSEWNAAVGPALAALAFVWLNGVLVRSVVQWAGVPFDADALWDATPLQSALSITWTLVALGAMVLCTRRGWRARWIAAASLLGVTVVKLFLVDLSKLSTGAKIGTFLVVGVLLLVVGYLSPVPPAQAEATETGGAS